MKKLTPICLLAVLSLSAVFAAQSKTARPQNNVPAFIPVTATSLKKEISARKGRVVIVNFWATWCPPCKTELPALLQLQKKYAQKGLSLLFVSADINTALDKEVRPFLRRQGATSPMRVIKGSTPDFVQQFDPKLKDAFVLPRFYIYNRKGMLIKSFTNEDVREDTHANLGHFEKIVKPLL